MCLSGSWQGIKTLPAVCTSVHPSAEGATQLSVCWTVMCLLITSGPATSDALGALHHTQQDAGARKEDCLMFFTRVKRYQWGVVIRQVAGMVTDVSC